MTEREWIERARFLFNDFQHQFGLTAPTREKIKALLAEPPTETVPLMDTYNVEDQDGRILACLSLAPGLPEWAHDAAQSLAKDIVDDARKRAAKARSQEKPEAKPDAFEEALHELSRVAHDIDGAGDIEQAIALNAAYALRALADRVAAVEARRG